MAKAAISLAPRPGRTPKTAALPPEELYERSQAFAPRGVKDREGGLMRTQLYYEPAAGSGVRVAGGALQQPTANQTPRKTGSVRRNVDG